jgi:2-polyprenyl-3-methyl-5-hydroxy-6-metoxy-1,4-benzoquinol methylase
MYLGIEIPYGIEVGNIARFLDSLYLMNPKIFRELFEYILNETVEDNRPIIDGQELFDGYKRFLKEFNTLRLDYDLEKSEVITSALSEPDVDFFEFFGQSLKPSESRPAIEGIGDGAIITLAEKIQGMNADFNLVDYGCGEGRLIYGLTRIDDRVLSHMTYIGVDRNQRYLERAGKIIQDTEFNKKVKKYHLVNPEKFDSMSNLDFIFLVNVLHEIHLLDLPQVLHNFEKNLNKGGIMVVHEMRELVEGELDFVSWDEIDFREVFKDTSFDISVHPYETRQGIPLINVHLTRRSELVTRLEALVDNCFDMFRGKLQRTNKELQEIKLKGKRSKRYAYLLVLKDNIEAQIRDYEEKEDENIDLQDPLGGITKCQSCGSRNFKRGMFYPGDDVWFTIKCQRCGWSEASE